MPTTGKCKAEFFTEVYNENSIIKLHPLPGLLYSCWCPLKENALAVCFHQQEFDSINIFSACIVGETHTTKAGYGLVI